MRGSEKEVRASAAADGGLAGGGGFDAGQVGNNRAILMAAGRMGCSREGRTPCSGSSGGGGSSREKEKAMGFFEKVRNEGTLSQRRNKLKRLLILQTIWGPCCFSRMRVFGSL
jgi:hypothetical protein